VTTDAIYSNPELARLYDAIDPAGAPEAFYVSLAGITPRRILEIGCGTGQLASMFAELGHDVTGLDPSGPMLDLARDRSDAVRWIDADGRSFSLGERFDLIVMNGHVFQVFLTDDDIRAVLRTCREHLAPGGTLAFETRNPAAREWDTWNEADSREDVEPEGVGPVSVAWQVTEDRWPFVTFETIYVFPDDTRSRTPSTLRFVTLEELLGFLAMAGFDEIEVRGDWDGAPWTPASPEIIALAR
jgi:SAM-dependent methyltransferase